MTWHDKVLWTEGMFLQPQHLQQSDRHMARIVDARLRQAMAHGMGFTGLAIDTAALLQGKLALAAARGVMPDGTPFDVPGDDAAPPALDVAATVRDEVVVLALAMARPGVPESDAEDVSRSMPPRYRATDVEVPDSHAASLRQAPLRLGRLNLRLLLARDANEGWSHLAVAHVVERRADGSLLLAPRFIAPSLHVGGSPVLDSCLREVIGMLRGRATNLASRLAQPGHAGVGEVSDFLFLQLCNRHEPVLTHLQRLPVLHPERLYMHLLALAGELCTFRESKRAIDYPACDPHDLQACFDIVMADLRQSLSIVIEHSAVRIELQLRNYGVRVALVPDVQLQRGAQFVLAVNAQVPGEALRTRFPALVKIGPVEQISNLVNLSLPGVALRPMPVAPRQIPFHVGFAYFELETTGSELWRQLEGSGALALHVGGEFPQLELEFWAIRA